MLYIDVCSLISILSLSPQTVINAVAIVNSLQSWPEPVVAEDGSEYVTMNKLKGCI